MARKKVAKNDKPKSRKKAGGKRGRGFFRFLISTPMRQIIMCAVIIALLVIFWGKIESTTGDALILFGWGLVFIIAAALNLFILGWRRRLGLLFFKWNLWLGGTAYVLAAWGMLATIDFSNGLFINGYGGSFGRGIIYYDKPVYVHILIIIALIIIGTFLIAPRPSFRTIKRFYFWLVDNFRRSPSRPSRREAKPHVVGGQRPVYTKPSAGGKPPLPAGMEKDIVPPEVSSARKKLEALAAKAAAPETGR